MRVKRSLGSFTTPSDADRSEAPAHFSQSSALFHRAVCRIKYVGARCDTCSPPARHASPKRKTLPLSSRDAHTRGRERGEVCSAQVSQHTHTPALTHTTTGRRRHLRRHRLDRRRALGRPTRCLEPAPGAARRRTRGAAHEEEMLHTAVRFALIVLDGARRSALSPHRGVRNGPAPASQRPERAINLRVPSNTATFSS